MDLELTIAGAPAQWVPGRAFPVKVVLRNTTSGPLDVQRLAGPNPALAFSVACPANGGAPQWHAGREASLLVGVPGEGMVQRAQLGAGQQWTSDEELGSYFVPPAPGKCELRARYASPRGPIETPAHAFDVPEANLAAASTTRERASEDLLVSAWGDKEAVWIRAANGPNPLAPRFFRRAAAAWPGHGVLHVAQHAFSPSDAASLAPYAYWVVWESDQTVGGALSDYHGNEIARIDPLAIGPDQRVLTPVQRENGELLLPVQVVKDGHLAIAWYRVDPHGGPPQAYASWTLPPGARDAIVGAWPDGNVATAWVASGARRVQGSLGPIDKAQPAVHDVLTVPRGHVAHLAFASLQGGITALAVAQDHDSASLHVHGPAGSEDSAIIALPSRGAPRELRGTYAGRNGAAIALRDQSDALWVTRAVPDAGWEIVPEVRAGYDFGVVLQDTGAVAWGADAKLGLRFARVGH
jgi:hypothetical protein